jgi:hypothetical protein
MLDRDSLSTQRTPLYCGLRPKFTNHLVNKCVRVGEPLATSADDDNGTLLHFAVRHRHVAFGTKTHPFPARPFAAPKFNHVVNTNLLRVLVLEPLQLLFCLAVISVINLKLRLKLYYLRYRVLNLTLKRVVLRFRQRKVFTEYRRRTVLRDKFLNRIKDAHGVSRGG